MSTAIYSLILNDTQLQGAFKRLITAANNLKPLWEDFGEHLIEPHESAWEAGRSPEGDAWAPLKPASWKRKTSQRMLYEEGDMLSGLVVQPSETELEFGLSNEKAVWHHFGTSRGLPARPLVGLSADDKAYLVDLIEDHIEEAWR